jgi:hypothetical protein
MPETPPFQIDAQTLIDPPITREHVRSLLRRAASRIRGIATREARDYLEFFGETDLNTLPEDIKSDVYFAARLDDVAARLGELKTEPVITCLGRPIGGRPLRLWHGLPRSLERMLQEQYGVPRADMLHWPPARPGRVIRGDRYRSIRRLIQRQGK